MPFIHERRRKISFLEKEKTAWWQKWKTVEHAFLIIHAKHLILKSLICTVVDFPWHNHGRLRRSPHKMNGEETSRHTGKKCAEGMGLAWAFLNFGLLALQRQWFLNVILIRHVHSRQSLHLEKFLSYDHCIIWGKQASYKMLEKPQHSEIVKTTRQQKGPSTENTICLSAQHEMSEVIMIPRYI